MARYLRVNVLWGLQVGYREALGRVEVLLERIAERDDHHGGRRAVRDFVGPGVLIALCIEV